MRYDHKLLLLRLWRHGCQACHAIITFLIWLLNLAYEFNRTSHRTIGRLRLQRIVTITRGLVQLFSKFANNPSEKQHCFWVGGGMSRIARQMHCTPTFVGMTAANFAPYQASALLPGPALCWSLAGYASARRRWRSQPRARRAAPDRRLPARQHAGPGAEQPRASTINHPSPPPPLHRPTVAFRVRLYVCLSMYLTPPPPPHSYYIQQWHIEPNTQNMWDLSGDIGFFSVNPFRSAGANPITNNSWLPVLLSRNGRDEGKNRSLDSNIKISFEKGSLSTNLLCELGTTAKRRDTSMAELVTKEKKRRNRRLCFKKHGDTYRTPSSITVGKSVVVIWGH